MIYIDLRLFDGDVFKIPQAFTMKFVCLNFSPKTGHSRQEIAKGIFTKVLQKSAFWMIFV